MKAFKIYLLDVGLLSCLAEMPQALIAESSAIFKEFKGSLTEQFVLQELACEPPESSIYYWTSSANAEVDFVFSEGLDVIPVEAKALLNTKAKSLSLYREKFAPAKSIRTSLQDFRVDVDVYNLPLYLLFQWKRYLRYDIKNHHS